MLRIGIIGCGTIGSALAKTIAKKFNKVAHLAFVTDLHPEKIQKLKNQIPNARFKDVSINELIQKSDLIIETASVKASAHVIPIALRRNKNILVLSVGGIIQIKNLDALLSKTKGNLYLASGGIAGIDGVLGSKTGRIDSVQITTRKPLKSLQSSPYFRKKNFGVIRKPTLIFEGNAESAIKNFPENVNVSVTLSLAGIGTKKTRVRVFTSPTYTRNQHEIEIESEFGSIKTQAVNLPSRENPKTSALAIGSAIATLEKMFSRLKVGT